MAGPKRGPAFSVERARQLPGERICAVPRLRQRLHRAPPGCERPFWADDPAFEVRHHIRQVACPGPGDERALLDAAAEVIAGAPLRAVLPIPSTGNACVTFAALPYAGTLWLTVLSDPALVPDAAELTAALRRELAASPRRRPSLATDVPDLRVVGPCRPWRAATEPDRRAPGRRPGMHPGTAARYQEVDSVWERGQTSASSA